MSVLVISLQKYPFYFETSLGLHRSYKDDTTLVQLLQMLASPIAVVRLSKIRNEHWYSTTDYTSDLWVSPGVPQMPSVSSRTHPRYELIQGIAFLSAALIPQDVVPSLCTHRQWEFLVFHIRTVLPEHS